MTSTSKNAEAWNVKFPKVTKQTKKDKKGEHSGIRSSNLFPKTHTEQRLLELAKNSSTSFGGYSPVNTISTVPVSAEIETVPVNDSFQSARDETLNNESLLINLDPVNIIPSVIKTNINQLRRRSREQLFDENRVLDADSDIDKNNTDKNNLQLKLNDFFNSRRSLEYFTNRFPKKINKMSDNDSNNGDDGGSNNGGGGGPNDSAGDLAQTMCKLLVKLTSSQISNVEDRIINYCCKYIVPFKVNNVRNFLRSVQSCCVRFSADNQVCVVLQSYPA